MITILDRQRRAGPPPWLAGARDLMQATAPDGQVWHAGQLATACVAGPWLDLGDGYAMGGAFDADDLAALERDASGYDLADVRDLRGRAWRAPRILDEDGARAFLVAYGDDWLPAPTAAQARLLEIAGEARRVLTASGEAPMAAACAWAAEFLCLAYHLSPRVLQRCAALDDALAIGVLAQACSLPLRRE